MRWLLSFLGTALFAGVAWEFGPLLPLLEPVIPRVLLIQSMFLLWAVANGLIEWRRRARDAALTSGLLAVAPGQEAAAVNDTLARALALLKGRARRGTLTELPWYAIIGPPGAGKTTALLNAGLTFTLADQLGQAAISGVGGTRMCEWWFTENAVLIDTAGRYTTQDSDAAVDRAGWEAFLALLKRTRPRQPLNGVIVAIGLPDVVQAAAAERDAHAAAIARRIAELERVFGVRMPVYALFTKADLVAGFMEFFDDLDHGQRDQVFGETFPLAPKTPLPERFASAFQGLVASLNARLLPRLQAEHRLERRGPIAGFPTQVASLERPLAGFVAGAFAATPMLRGVYFASGTQEGTPIDRLTGAMARTFGIDQSRAAALRPEKGRSYFLGRLLRDVVFGEAMLVQEPPGTARRRLFARASGFALVLLALAGAAGALLLSDRGAEAEIDRAAAALAAWAPAGQAVATDPVTDGDLRPVASALDRAQSLASEAGSTSSTPAALGFNPSATLREGQAGLTRNLLAYAFFPRLVWRLETQLRGSLARPEALYAATRIYLMLGGVGPLDAAQLRDWFARDWEQAYPEDDDAPLRASLAADLDRLLAEPLPPIALDGALVEQARAGIARVKLPDRVYAGIRASPAAIGLPPWRPSDVLGLAGAQVFARASGKPMTDGIPGFYSARGWREVLLPAVAAAARQVAAEGWVIGRREDVTSAELADLQAGVTALYAADFTARWDAMLADLNVAPAASIPQAAQSLYILTSPDSPLRAVLKSAAAQLALPPTAPFAQRYRALIDLATGDGTALERTLRLVADVQQPLAKIAALPVGTAAPPGGEDIGVALLADAARQPQPLARWLGTVATSAQALRTGNARRQVVIAYNAPGGPAQACAAALTRFPFAAAGTPLPLEDFSRVFGPAGALDGFLNTQLKPYVDTSAKPWKPVVSEAAPALLAPADVAQFQRATAIRDAFFPAGSATPRVQIDVAPVGSDPRPALLDLAGTRIETGHGPVHAAQVTWPAADPAAAASFAADPAPPITETGPWAMFRLLARGRLQPAPPPPGRTLLTFATPAGPVAYELRTGGAGSPLTPGLFSDFRCPTLQ